MYNGTDFYGQLDSYWIPYYLFPQKFLNIKYLKEDSEKINIWSDIAKSCFYWYPYENICFISSRPTEINKNGIQLHADGKPALSFKDGYNLWYLNGVAVTEDIVMTPAEQLDPNLILTEKNVEVRREIVRKIGIERVIQKLGAEVLDTFENYQLLRLNKVEGMQNKPVYLKMKNPSIGVWHVEGVDSKCKTVKEALHFRKPKALQNIPIDEVNGKDWYQQGDVCIWPKDATSLKFFPSVLT
jgi:hypothetical protein